MRGNDQNGEEPMTLEEREFELKKRLEYPSRWHRKQTDEFDRLTSFIYKTPRFDEVMAEIQHRFGSRAPYEELRDYALNRWFNKWSSAAVESVFGSVEGVVPSVDGSDRLVDFTINGIKFDHKTTVFPKGFDGDLASAKSHPRRLIEWLYRNQSTGQRYHLQNRLFVVLYDEIGDHWKLRAEVGLLKSAVLEYVSRFDPDSLHTFEFSHESETLADVIWVIK